MFQWPPGEPTEMGSGGWLRSTGSWAARIPIIVGTAWSAAGLPLLYWLQFDQSAQPETPGRSVATWSCAAIQARRELDLVLAQCRGRRRGRREAPQAPRGVERAEHRISSCDQPKLAAIQQRRPLTL
jgi:hypothetical protein